MMRAPNYTGPNCRWTPELDAELAKLWGLGLRTADIAARMKLSKNAVVGRAHRINLPSRPSPIRRASRFDTRGPLFAVPARRQGPIYMSDAARSTDPAALPEFRRRDRRRSEVPTREWTFAPGQRHLMSQLETAREGRFLGVSSLNSAPVVASNGGAGVAFSELRGTHCRWPLWGNERQTEFMFCGCPAVPGRPYCAGHQARALVKSKQRENAE